MPGKPRSRNAELAFINEEMKVVNAKVTTVRGNTDSYLVSRMF